MRFLIDNALSPAVAEGLRQAGHDAVHVRDLGLAAAPDTDVFARGEAEDRILVSADTDFGTLLALRHLPKPSFILLRGEVPRRPNAQAALILANLPGIAAALDDGSVVVIEATRVRIRALPIPGA